MVFTSVLKYQCILFKFSLNEWVPIILRCIDSLLHRSFVGLILHGGPTTGVTKAVVCAILTLGAVYIKEPLLRIGKSSPCSGGSRFPLSIHKCSLTVFLVPYNHIKMC